MQQKKLSLTGRPSTLKTITNATHKAGREDTGRRQKKTIRNWGYRVSYTTSCDDDVFSQILFTHFFSNFRSLYFNKAQCHEICRFYLTSFSGLKGVCVWNIPLFEVRPSNGELCFNVIRLAQRNHKKRKKERERKAAAAAVCYVRQTASWLRWRQRRRHDDTTIRRCCLSRRCCALRDAQLRASFDWAMTSFRLERRGAMTSHTKNRALMQYLNEPRSPPKVLLNCCSSVLLFSFVSDLRMYDFKRNHNKKYCSISRPVEPSISGS